MYVCICVYMYVCMYVCICMHICMYVYVCVCIHVYVCMHNIWGNCLGGMSYPKREGELSGGKCPGELSGGNCPTLVWGLCLYIVDVTCAYQVISPPIGIQIIRLAK